MQITSKNSPRHSENRTNKVSAIVETSGNFSADQRLPLALHHVDGRDILPTNLALVPIRTDTGPVARPVARAGRISAPLVTHLVATRMGMPQTRARRRASADHATIVYQDVTRAPHIPPTGTRASKYL